jgi:DNA uptake protein ComE-like DNA-binding protein/endonuclease YncB( thermonuclease family)
MTIRASLFCKIAAIILASFWWATPNACSGDWVQLNDCRLVPHEGNDGDSFHFESGGREYIARLYFVDCPEKDDQFPDRIAKQMEDFGVSEEKIYAYGREAKKFTEHLLVRPFIVVTRFQDAMGRSKLPRYYSFIFPNGSRPDLGSLLTNAGLARSFGQKAANDLGLDRGIYDKLENNARRNRVGIYGGNRPADYREETPSVKEPHNDSPPEVVTDENSQAPGSNFSFEAANFLSSWGEQFDKAQKARRDAMVGQPPVSTKKSSSAPRTGLINLNKATRSELEELPGVGRALAEGIIRSRPISSLDDLHRVPRLGDSVIKRIAPLVEF